MNQMKELNIHQVISELNNIIVPIDLKNNNESIISNNFNSKVSELTEKMENEDSVGLTKLR